jgi:hypothetical protein
MQGIKFCFVLIILLLAADSNAQVQKELKKKTERSRIELSFNIGYSRPLLEAYGTNMTINATVDQIYINGKRILISDNLAANTGYGVQGYMKYSFMKKGYVKGLANFGYNMLTSHYPGPDDEDIGSRIQTFSFGLGTEINPLGHESRFYPSVFGLMRLNMVGGETFYNAGVDFFKVVPRYGYSAGFNLNYGINKTLGLFWGYTYTYDNAWGKETAEVTPVDAHVIVFRDKKSSTNGLTSDRRIAYWSIFMGMNFFFQ